MSSTNRGPLALGYIRRHPLMTDSELEGMRAKLASFAAAGGLHLAAVYIDSPASTPTQYGAMVTAAQRQHAMAILVADVDHLGPLGGRAAVKANVETYTNARVIVVPDDAPSPARWAREDRPQLLTVSAASRVHLAAPLPREAGPEPRKPADPLPL